MLRLIAGLSISLFIGLEYSIYNLLVLIIFYFLGSYFLKGPESKLFSTFFLFYTAFTLFTDYFLVYNQYEDFFYAIDSQKFIKYASDVKYIEGLKDFWVQVLLFPDFIGYNIINKLTFYLGNAFGVINQFLFKTQNIFLGSLIVVYVFKLIRLFYTENIAIKSAQIYGIFTVVFTFSAIFNRDIHIAFILLLYFYTVLQNPNIPKLKLFLISLSGFLFRPEHGAILLIFTIFLVVYEVFENTSKRNQYSTMIVLIICVLIPTLFLLKNQINLLTETYQNYTERTSEVATDGSFAIFLNKNLPFGIKQIVLGSYSQLAPFPFWRNLVPGSLESGNSIFRIQEAIAGILWPLVFIGSLLSLTTKKFHWFNNKKVLVLFLFSLIVIAGSSAEINIRRIFGVYPMLFLMFLPYYFSLNKKVRSATLILFIILSISLQSSFLFL